MCSVERVWGGGESSCYEEDGGSGVGIESDGVGGVGGYFEVVFEVVGFAWGG